MNENQLHEMSSAFMPGCVVGAAAELDLFSVLGDESLDLESLANRLGADSRAMEILLDALVALELLEKKDDRYHVPKAVRPLVDASCPGNMLPAFHHRMNLLRRWSRLAEVVRSGMPAVVEPSIRGAEADRAAFVAAMHNFSLPIARQLVDQLVPPGFTHLLDVGGASGTWTMAFLQAVPEARATIFDLADAIAQAQERLARTEYAGRLTFASGDFFKDDLPQGADFAWVSAIVHQFSREENRRLLGKVHAALVPDGRVAIRDVVMEASRTKPLHGALFAVNMLVGTTSGGTFTFDELAEDLAAAGFVEPTLAVEDAGMNSVVVATKP